MSYYYPTGLGKTVERADAHAIISIQDTYIGGFDIRFMSNQFCQDVLTLYFDDVILEVEGAVHFTYEMPEQIMAFIKKDRNVDT